MLWQHRAPMEVAHDVAGVRETVAGAPGGRRLLGGRYQILNEIGRGGMGQVYRVLDRLTGRVITLKRVIAPLDLGGKDSREGRVSLASEFRLLASLRHPNIISVLDYGFDEYGEPFYTMDLAENARTIVDAGASAPLAVQVELLGQTLRALVYLHRHGIVHRDLKPSNILVVGDQVKLLDFGLALRRDENDPGEFAGTPLYMAPELLSGESASERSDLYALGMVAYEMLLGRYPFDLGDAHGVYRAIMTQALPLGGDPIDPRLRPTLAWLLTKDAARRPGDAGEVISALARAVGLPLATETAATRESLLQAAPFVGRQRELGTLLAALRGAREGRGGAWLVAGESGVGKSRLLEEIRAGALVDDVAVATGQVRSRAGGPYHAWQDVFLTLVLGVEVTDAEASALKGVVPGIEAVLGRSVPDAPPLDPESAQSRLLFAVEALLRRQPQPVLVVIEDLQWAGSETLRLWSWLAHGAADARLMLLGSLRTEEAPHLLEELSVANVLQVQRLDPGEAAHLAESMMGASAREPAVVDLLAREAEGIPFFLVELVRTLAEHAGGLDAIRGDTLAPGLWSDRMTRLVRRRLDRVPSGAMAALQAAAVAGRAVDLPLLQTMFPALDIDEWTACCSAPAVLELSNQDWRFSHDKLREQILLDLEPAQLRVLHRRVAEAIELIYPDHTGLLTALAHHWRGVGDPEKEAGYAQRAGLLALQNGACREAITLLSRTLELLERGVAAPAPTSRRMRPRSIRSLLDPNAGIDPDSIEFRLGTIEGALTEAYYRLGDLRGCREHAERALGLLGQRLPTRTVGWVTGSARQGVVRALQSAWKRPPADPERTRCVAGVLGRVYVRLAESYIFRLEPLPMLWSTLCFINHCEAAGPSPELALGYLVGALRAEAIPARRVSRAWSARALDIAQRTGAPRDVAFVQSRISMIHMGACRWPEAAAAIDRATQVSDAVHDLRLSIECRALAGALCEFTGEFARGTAVWKDAHRLSLTSGNRQTEFWGLVGQADNWARLGHYDEALRLFEAADEKVDEDAMRSEAVWRFGMLALTRLRVGDAKGAHDAAMRALRHLRATTPIVYYMQSGSAATVEVLLALREAQRDGLSVGDPTLDRDAHDACASLRRFASSFALGRPHALLWSGNEAWLDGRPGRARRLWERARAEASARAMPYEEASAHLEIGRHLEPADPARQYHLRAAVAVFERVGCAADAARTRAILGAAR